MVLISKLRQLWLSAFVQNYWPLLTLGSLSLLIIGPALGRGYLLQYDMLFVPHPAVDWSVFQTGQSLYSGLPVQLILQASSHLLPMDIVQKLILWALFFGASMAMYRILPLSSRPARLFGAIAYSMNPFTFDRLMAGHWLFLAGFALLPIVLHTVVLALTEPSPKQVIFAILAWTAAILASPHYLAIGAVLFVYVALTLVRTRQAAIAALGICAGLLLLNSWWLLPRFLIHNFTQDFSLSELYAFASRPDPQYGFWFNLVSMQGFWYTGWHGLKQVFGWWPLLTGLWLLPVFAGLAVAYQLRGPERRWLGGLLVAGIIGLCYAIGPATWIGPLNTWAFTHVPGMSGLREPQKLLCLTVLAYAVFFAYGCDFMFKQVSDRILQWGTRLAVAVIVLLMASPLFWAAHRQMHPVTYSPGWQFLDSRLKDAGPDAKVIVVPWSIYIDKSFTGRLTANPAQAYFGGRQVSSQRAGVPGVTDYTVPAYLPLQSAIDRQDSRDFTVAAEQLHARYVLLVKSNENQSYDWLNRTPGAQVIHSDSQITIYALTRR